MTQYHLYFRMWQHFTDKFPFDQFNHLEDDKIGPALEEFAERWFQENDGETRLAEKRQEFREKCERWMKFPSMHRPRGSRPPIDPQSTGRRQLLWHHKDSPRLIMILNLAGFAHIVEFDENKPSIRIFARVVEDRQIAEKAALILNNDWLNNWNEGTSITFRFGVIPSNELSELVPFPKRYFRIC